MKKRIDSQKFRSNISRVFSLLILIPLLALIILPVSVTGQTSVLHVMPHFHYDVAWQETEESYGAKGAELIHQYLQKAKSDPGYKFVLDQVPLIKYFIRYHPDELPYLQELIAEGRCEIFGAMNVQGDENLVIGESLVRQIIYGQKWYEENLATRGVGSWNIDDFGHSAQMPQILARSGLHFCAFARGDNSVRPKTSEFYWTAADGSMVLTHWMPEHYNTAKDIGDQASDDSDIQTAIDKLKGSALSGNMFGLNGDDLTPPRAFLSEAINHWNTNHATLKLHNSTPSDFFNSVLASNVQIPQVGPIEFQRTFTGCYSSRIDIKQRNRRLEHLMLTSEKISTMAAMEGASFPVSLFDKYNADFLINQMHDILPGSAIDPVYIDAIARFDRCEQAFNQALNSSLDYLVPQINTQSAAGSSSKALVVFNQLNWLRHEVLTVPYDATVMPFPFRITDMAGKEIPYQIIANKSSSPKQLAFLVDIPSMGYATYYFQPGITPAVSPYETKTMIVANQIIESSEFSVAFSSSGEISSLKDKKLANREWIRSAVHGANQLTVRQDNGNSWEYNRSSEVGSTKGSTQTLALYKGPVVQRAVILGAMPSAASVQREVRLYEDFHRIDCLTDIDWQGEWKYVFVSFPFNTGSTRLDGIPYGSIQRPLGEFPVSMWSDLGSNSDGITILNKGLPDHELTSDGMAITLLRSHGGPNGNSTDHFMKGLQSFEYSLLPHAGSPESGHSAQKAWELNAPMVYSWSDIHSGSLPATKSYVTANESVVLSVMNQDDYGYQLRFYNPYAATMPNFNMTVNAPGVLKIEETNLMGIPESDLAAGNQAELLFNTMEIKTVRAVLTANDAARLAIHPDSAMYLAPGQPGWLTVSSENGNGKMAYSGNSTIRVTSTAAGMSFSLDRQNWQNTQDIILNRGTARVFFRNNSSGTYSITATDLSGKLAPVTKNDIIMLGPDHLSFYPSDTLVVTPNTSTSVLLEVRDQRNIKYANTTPLQVQITSNRSSLKFKATDGTWQSQLNAELVSGQLKILFKDALEGQAALTAYCISATDLKPATISNIFICKNLALKKKATADGECNASTERAIDAVDGSLTTKWCGCTGGEEHWLAVDLGSLLNVDYFVVKHAGATQAAAGTPGADDKSSMNTARFQLQTGESMTGPWTTVVDVPNNPPTLEGDVTYHALPKSVQTRYIRLNILDPGQDAAARIYEFEAYDLSSVSAVGQSPSLPSKFELLQNYPNPFNPGTIISYQLPERSFVQLKVYNLLGKEIGTLVNEYKAAGSYSAEFKGRDIPSGVYFYRIQAGEFSESRKMILLK